jgi:hypothetical protein
MNKKHRRIVLAFSGLMVGLLLLAAVPGVAGAAEEKARLDIYGFAMLDMGYQFGQSDPDWFDVMRPTKLPSVENQYGEDGHFYAGVRQTRLGFKGFIPTPLGELKTIFEFEMFGVGDDAGQTTIRLRHAYGELGQFGAGQYWSPFMDIDVFPNSIEYWGPNGMAFYRNVQVRWMPIKGDSFLTFALERPGASIDGVSTSNPGPNAWSKVQGRFPAPDLSAEYRFARPWGYIEAAGILRYIKWDDVTADTFELSGSDMGRGLTVSSNIKVFEKKGTLRLQGVYGEGIQNYMNDATVDIGAKTNSDPEQPVVGEALPIWSVVAFYDHNWNDRWSSSIGYSRLDMNNSNDQAADAFKTGQYALVNLLHYPTKNVMMGAELQWGWRENNSDDWTYDDFRIQFSAKYNFNASIGG